MTGFCSLPSKGSRRKKQFQNAEDARAFVEGVILDIPQSTWSNVIDSWFEKMIKILMCTGWGGGGGGGVLRKTGVDRLAVSVVEKPDCKT